MKRFLEKNNHEPFVLTGCLLPAFCVICSLLLPAHSASTWERHPSRCTVMCYMNGDNDLNNEVLHAVDMMETVGSSKNLNILALVDGSRTSQHGYGRIWEKTRLLHITKDDHMGVINSPVLRELGERDLGDPQTLERFVRDCLKFPAERVQPSGYVVAHSRFMKKKRGDPHQRKEIRPSFHRILPLLKRYRFSG